MYRLILCAAAALLVSLAVQSVAADDARILGTGDESEVISRLNEKIGLNPKSFGLYLLRGLMYSRKGNYVQAISDFDQATTLDPKRAIAYSSRGSAYYRKGDYDRAIADADEAIRLIPINAGAYNNRGEAYEAKNDLDHAIADFDQARKLDPSLAEARRGFERVQALLAKRSSPGAQFNGSAR